MSYTILWKDDTFEIKIFTELSSHKAEKTQKFSNIYDEFFSI